MLAESAVVPRVPRRRDPTRSRRDGESGLEAAGAKWQGRGGCRGTERARYGEIVGLSAWDPGLRRPPGGGAARQWGAEARPWTRLLAVNGLLGVRPEVGDGEGVLGRWPSADECPLSVSGTGDERIGWFA